MPANASVIYGGTFSDSRGQLNFVNEFRFEGIKRFYELMHFDTITIRAWQGHKVENKYFYVTSGSFLIAWVEIDNWLSPSDKLKAKHIILTSDTPTILHIPGGYANGIKAMVPESKVMVYSNLTLQESENDRWSFDNDLWFDWKNIKE